MDVLCSGWRSILVVADDVLEMIDNIVVCIVSGEGGGGGILPIIKLDMGQHCINVTENQICVPNYCR